MNGGGIQQLNPLEKTAKQIASVLRNGDQQIVTIYIDKSLSDGNLAKEIHLGVALLEKRLPNINFFFTADAEWEEMIETTLLKINDDTKLIKAEKEALISAIKIAQEALAVQSLPLNASPLDERYLLLLKTLYAHYTDTQQQNTKKVTLLFQDSTEKNAAIFDIFCVGKEKAELLEQTLKAIDIEFKEYSVTAHLKEQKEGEVSFIELIRCSLHRLGIEVTDAELEHLKIEGSKIILPKPPVQSKKEYNEYLEDLIKEAQAFISEGILPADLKPKTPLSSSPSLKKKL